MGWFLLLLVRVGSLFVPSEEYQQKVESIVPMDQKLAKVDLGDWEYVSVPGRRLNVEHRYFRLSGQDTTKPALLFLHGLMLDGRTFHNLTDLRKKWRLLSYDFPESTQAYHGNLDDFVELVEDFAEAVDVQEADLMGVSFGAVVAVRLAAAVRPRLRIRSCILASTQIAGTTKASRRQSRRTHSFTSSLPDYKYYWLVEKILERTARDYTGSKREILDSLFRVKHLEYYRQVSDALLGYNAADDARNVQCPVLVLQGGGDGLFSRREAHSPAKYLNDAHYHEIPRAGHAMVVTHPQIVVRHILEFREQTMAILTGRSTDGVFMAK